MGGEQFASESSGPDAPEFGTDDGDADEDPEMEMDFDAEYDGSTDDDDDDDDDDGADDDEDGQDRPRNDIEEDDTEEDLAAMLKARIGGDNDEDEEDDDGPESNDAKNHRVTAGRSSVAEGGDEFTVQPRQATEVVCTVCFLIINKVSASASYCPHCGADRTPVAAR